MIVTLAVFVWLPLSVLLAWVLGAPSMGLGMAGIAIVLTVVITASVFQRIKRGRPDGYRDRRACGHEQRRLVLRSQQRHLIPVTDGAGSDQQPSRELFRLACSCARSSWPVT